MDTIFAPITPAIKSAIIVLRISGDKARECSKYLGITKKLEDRVANLCKIYDPKTKEIIDEAVVTFFQNPHSFTGEDVLEIGLHGSTYIFKKVTETLCEIKNVRIAEAGEFSKRAFLNNKIDLLEAESIVDLINAETKAQSDQALRQMQGELGKIYNSWREELLKITANIEAFIDFPDEDLPKDIIEDLESKVENLNREIENHLNDNKRGEKIREGLKLAIIGAPNVGKSTLINYLAKSEVAIVSHIAGTTRDVIDVHLNIGGYAVVISDTAGIRKTEDLIEKEGVKRALAKASDADLKIVVLNVDNPCELDDNLIDDDSIVVINKIDLKTDFIKSIKNIKLKHQPILVSLKEKTNLDLLMQELERKVKEIAPIGSTPPITQERYRQSLIKINDHLNHFSLTKNIEFAAEDLRLAIREIGKITGKVEVDDILDIIFKGFCIGK